MHFQRSKRILKIEFEETREVIWSNLIVVVIKDESEYLIEFKREINGKSISTLASFFPPVYWSFHLIKSHQSICTIILDIVSYFICLHVEAEKSKFMYIMKCNKGKHFSNLRCIKITGSLCKLKLLEPTFRDSDLCLGKSPEHFYHTLRSCRCLEKQAWALFCVGEEERKRYHLLDRKRTVCVTFLVSFFLTS